MSNNTLPAEVQGYNPIMCEHKLPNGLTAWHFQSEEQSNLGGANKVSIHVCALCGEISIGGFRPSKNEKHTNSFHETFDICHPDAIDAIIKRANFYNEKAKWGRIDKHTTSPESITALKIIQQIKSMTDPEGFVKKLCDHVLRKDESAKVIEYMPVHPDDAKKPGCPQVFPMHLLNEKQAVSNHGQSLRRLKERGGLSVKEILSIVHGKRWDYYRYVKWEEALGMLNVILNFE